MKPKTKRLKPAQIRLVSRGTTQTLEDLNESIIQIPATTARDLLRQIGYEKIGEEKADRWTQIEIWELPKSKQLPN
jgi:hypothetical protein